MDICSSNHEEIVYDRRRCPLCDANEEIRNLTDVNERLEEALRDAGRAREQ